MSLRYIARRAQPEDLSEIKTRVNGLEQQLGPADEDFKRTISVRFSPLRHAHYVFSTRKVGETWEWVCPCIEFDVEDEEGLLALTEVYKVPWPSHLKHPKTAHA